MKLLIKAVLVIVIVTFPLGTVLAQTVGAYRDKLVSNLTGDSSRRWVFERLVTIMGSGKEKCSQGELWTFFDSGRVLVTRCEAGGIIQYENNWSVAASGRGDFELVLNDGIKYVLKITNLPSRAGVERKKMILRQKANRITEKTVDRVFRWENQ